VVDDPDARRPGIRSLVERFSQYREEPSSGPLLVVTVDHWTGWSSSS
jgi:hypothetical protein